MEATLEYVIVDVETTGMSGTAGNRITEIALIVHNGNHLVTQFHSLVNPESSISKFVTSLTGIDESMVHNAPRFEEIADEILNLTKDRIFVAHNVNFDYNILKKEFERAGLEFNRKRLCTVRLSKQLLPGYRSYSLGNLCKHLGIAISSRHRAKGDVDATAVLFERLLEKDKDNILLNYIKANSRESTLPPLLPKDEFHNLPTVQGVYYFKNSKGDIIYVGKAKNIKKRVLGHFYHKSAHEIALCKEIARIDYEITGNELIALLLESDAIKKHYPKYNRAQKKTNTGYGIVSYKNRSGIMQLGYLNSKQCVAPVFLCYSVTEVHSLLEMLCLRFELCPKYTQLQQNVESCSHFKISTCKGVCRNTEAISDYNKRVQKAISFLKEACENLLIIEEGRVDEEFAFVLVKDGFYKGYGYMPKQKAVTTIDDVIPRLHLMADNSDVKRILAQYIRKNPHNCNITDL